MGAGEASGMIKQGSEGLILKQLRPGSAARVAGVLLQKNGQGRWGGGGGYEKDQLECPQS